MPMTAAERQAKRRARLRENEQKYAEYKKKNALYQKKSRIKKRESELHLTRGDTEPSQRQYCEEARKRMAKSGGVWRQLKKDETKR